jgi:hypothetical protein
MQQKPLRTTKKHGKGIIAGALLAGSLTGLAPSALAANQDMTPERCYPWNFPCWYSDSRLKHDIRPL